MKVEAIVPDTDLLMSKGVLSNNKLEVPIIQVCVINRVRKVTAADHFVIPAQNECIINVYLKRKEYDFSFGTDYMVQSTEHFKAEYPLQMANTLVNINEACNTKVKILNHFPTTVSIKQDVIVSPDTIVSIP